MSLLLSVAAAPAALALQALSSSRLRRVVSTRRGAQAGPGAVSVFAPTFEQRVGFAAAEAKLAAMHAAECTDADARARDAEFWAELERRLAEAGLPPASLGPAAERVLWRFRHMLLTHRLFSLPLSGRTRTQGATRLALGPTAALEGGRRRVRPLCHFPNLEPSRPWHDPAAFAWLPRLEEKRGVILEELEAALAASGEGSLQGLWTGNDQAQFDAHGWTQVSLSTFGRDHAQGTQFFPRTLEILRDLQVPLGPGDCCLVRQAPNTGLPRHADDRAHFLTAHLTLKAGAGCDLTVDGETRPWSPDAPPTVIDTTFWHSTSNASEEPAFVLLMDFWHPGLSAQEIKALEVYFQLDAEDLAATLGVDAASPSFRAAYEDFAAARAE